MPPTPLPRHPLPRRALRLLPVLGTLALAGCVTAVDSRPQPPHRPDRVQACTREYRPVCATSGRDRQTFPNACEARRAGYRVDHSGTCRNRPDRPTTPPRPGRPQACTMEYAPVCGRVGGSFQTFGNACMARAAGAANVTRGQCRAGASHGRR